LSSGEVASVVDFGGRVGSVEGVCVCLLNREAIEHLSTSVLGGQDRTKDGHWCRYIFFFFFKLAVLGFELRALDLLEQMLYYLFHSFLL
jgi:hypothetical protein